MRTTALVASVPLLCLLISLPSSSSAQIQSIMLTITTEEWTGAFDCEPQSACEGSTAQPTPGTYLFRIFAGPEWDQAREAWFGLDFPDDFEILEWSLCQDGLISGDPAHPGDGLHFRGEDCFQTDLPVIQYVLDCPSPGRIQLAARDTLGATSCGGEFLDFWNDRYVEIGDFCGRLPQHPCWHCDDFYGLAGHFQPATAAFRIEAGQVAVDTIQAWSPVYCTVPAECGWYQPTCLGSVSTDTRWIGLQSLSHLGTTHTYEVTVSATDLAVGHYDGRIDLRGDCCEPTCMEVDLDVLPPSPVLQGSWGDLKRVMSGR